MHFISVLLIFSLLQFEEEVRPGDNQLRKVVFQDNQLRKVVFQPTGSQAETGFPETALHKQLLELRRGRGNLQKGLNPVYRTSRTKHLSLVNEFWNKNLSSLKTRMKMKTSIGNELTPNFGHYVKDDKLHVTFLLKFYLLISSLTQRTFWVQITVR